MPFNQWPRPALRLFFPAFHFFDRLGEFPVAQVRIERGQEYRPLFEPLNLIFLNWFINPRVHFRHYQETCMRDFAQNPNDNVALQRMKTMLEQEIKRSKIKNIIAYRVVLITLGKNNSERVIFESTA